MSLLAKVGTLTVISNKSEPKKINQKLWIMFVPSIPVSTSSIYCKNIYTYITLVHYCLQICTFLYKFFLTLRQRKNGG